MENMPLHWEHGVLTTGPPRKSQDTIVLISDGKERSQAAGQRGVGEGQLLSIRWPGEELAEVRLREVSKRESDVDLSLDPSEGWAQLGAGEEGDTAVTLHSPVW